MKKWIEKTVYSVGNRVKGLRLRGYHLVIVGFVFLGYLGIYCYKIFVPFSIYFIILGIVLIGGGIYLWLHGG